MPVYKDKERGTWYASFYYTDWQGKRKLKKKRGFARAKDAKAYEEEFLSRSSGNCDMTFESLVDLYLEDMRPRLKPSTFENKSFILRCHILPFFGDMRVNEITAVQIRKWQTDLIAHGFAPSYLRLINVQLNATLNFAARYYGLQQNPGKQAGSIGKAGSQEEMKFWTVEQFNQFIRCVKNPADRAGFEILFWTGVRIGELLALTPADIDLEAGTLSVNKNLQTVKGSKVIMTPKTEGSVRTIQLPEKLCNIIREYESQLFHLQPDDRLFPYTPSHCHWVLRSACKAAGMEPIRLHDFRHSHAALLISMGVPTLLISQRLGHENVQTTLNTYGHLYPSAVAETVENLNNLMS